MPTIDAVITPRWTYLVPDGDEFLLTLSPAQAAQIQVVIFETEYVDGLVADLTALAAVVGPQDGDRHLVIALNQVYAWDDDGGEDENGAWVAEGPLDEYVHATGHVLSSLPRLGQMDSLNRVLIGPGHVLAKSQRDSLTVALTTWTP
jgi:hypothetical protein